MLRRPLTTRLIVVLFAASCGLGAGSAALAAGLASSGGEAPQRIGPAPVFARTFGALDQPDAVALDQSGHVWVADRGSNLVDEFSGAGRLIRKFGGAALRGPEGIATAPGGNVWVADTGHDRIVEFSPRGARIRVVGSAGTARGKLRSPAGLAVAPDGDVYVADFGNSR